MPCKMLAFGACGCLLFLGSPPADSPAQKTPKVTKLELHGAWLNLRELPAGGESDLLEFPNLIFGVAPGRGPASKLQQGHLADSPLRAHAFVSTAKILKIRGSSCPFKLDLDCSFESNDGTSLNISRTIEVLNYDDKVALRTRDGRAILFLFWNEYEQ